MTREKFECSHIRGKKSQGHGLLKTERRKYTLDTVDHGSRSWVQELPVSLTFQGISESQSCFHHNTKVLLTFTVTCSHKCTLQLSRGYPTHTTDNAGADRRIQLFSRNPNIKEVSEHGKQHHYFFSLFFLFEKIWLFVIKNVTYFGMWTFEFKQILHMFKFLSFNF